MTNIHPITLDMAGVLSRSAMDIIRISHFTETEVAKIKSDPSSIHDMCDSNEIMYEAWLKAFNVDDVDLSDEANCEVWNAAWKMIEDKEIPIVVSQV